MVEIKFCGMTRPEDAREASALGAAYAGVIFAESPRKVGEAQATKVLDATAAGTARVGVFGPAGIPAIAGMAVSVGLDVTQLHGDPDAAFLTKLRRAWEGQVWAVLRVAGSELPPNAVVLFDAADAVVLDARVSGQLGGTGMALPWEQLAVSLAPMRGRRAKLVLAGGLNSGNVSHAIELLNPDVVDVSSGVEAAPGVKDPAKMRSFRDAVQGAAAR